MESSQMKALLSPRNLTLTDHTASSGQGWAANYSLKFIHSHSPCVHSEACHLFGNQVWLCCVS